MIEFYKIQGSGNDFILIDNRENALKDVGRVDEFVKHVCRQHVSVGADGLILIESSHRAHFRWRFFNADGSEVEMCGNGGRCAARFALIRGIAPERMSFETRAGIIDAEVSGQSVKLRLPDPKDLRRAYTIDLDGVPTLVSSINTGVPHVVAFVDDVDGHDVFTMGRTIRYHGEYRPAGTNANFARVLGRHRIRPGPTSAASRTRRWPAGRGPSPRPPSRRPASVSYTHLRAHETPEHHVCRLLLEKKKQHHTKPPSTHTTS